MTSLAPTIRLTFADADPSTPDPAAVGALARAAVGALRASGESLAPDYTGTKGAAEVFQWMLDAATVAGPFVTLSGFCLTLAQLLNELRKLHEKAPPAAPPPAPVTINIYYGSAPPIVLPGASTPTDAALLEGLLTAQLPAQLDPAETAITVQVPPTPPNEI
jgi:hypothetical protein